MSRDQKAIATLGIGFFPFAVFIVVCIFFSYFFDRDCTGHLKRAGDANTVELAKQELAVSIKYLEDHKITAGTTAVIFDEPSCDVGFWYKNLTASMEELESLDKPTHLEASNMLLKLRETLLDHDNVTCPPGISWFPNNGALVFLLWFCFVWLGGCLLLLFNS